MSNDLPVLNSSSTLAQGLIPIEEVVARAKSAGVDFGKGNPINRIRYFAKLGLIPEAKRKSFNGAPPAAAYSPKVVDQLVEYERQIAAGKTVQDLLKENSSTISKNPLPSRESEPTIRNFGEQKPVFTVTAIPSYSHHPAIEKEEVKETETPKEESVVQEVKKPFLSEKQAGYLTSLVLLAFILGIAGLIGSILLKYNSLYHFNVKDNDLPQLSSESRQVLGALTTNPYLTITSETEIKGLLNANGGIKSNGEDIDAGTGNVYGANLIYGISAGSNISVSPGQTPTISIIGVSPSSSSYITLGNDASLTNERKLTAGSGISFSDGGANSNLTVSLTTSSLTVNAGNGLDGGGAVSLGGSTTVNIQACADGEILKYNTGVWACDLDLGSTTGVVTIKEDLATYNGVTAINFTGDDFTVTCCPGTQANITIDYTNSGITRRDENETIIGSWSFPDLRLTNTSDQLVLSSGNTVTIDTATQTGSFTVSFPTLSADDTFCLQSTGCSGSVVTSLNGLTGALTIANATGSGSTITIDDALADDATKGIAAFNSTNFSASAGVVNTIQDINSTASPTFGTLTLGADSTSTGVITLKNSSNAFDTVIQAGVASASFTLTLPVDDGANTQCLKTDGSGVLSWDDCLGGGGGGVTSLNGLSGALSVANASGSGSTITIDNAAADGATKGIAAFNSTNFSAASGIVNTIQNINSTATPTFGSLTLGAASTTTGVITLKNSTNAFNTIIQSGVAGASFTLTLPVDDGANNDCLKSDGNGNLFWQTCLGGGGGGVSSLNGLTGALSIANASGSGSTVTIDNAAADGATKGIAAFNSTNFTASSGVINTIQNIHTGASPSFVAATLTGSGGLTLGTSSSLNGQIVLRNSTNNFTATIQSGVTSASYSLTLPVDDGLNTQCLKTDGNGVLSWGDCVAAAAGVTSLNSLTGALSIANASGSGSTITIDNAAADGATKGIAAFNSTNFSASSGVINTIQNIHTGASPNFVAATLTGSGGLTLGTASSTTGVLTFKNSSNAFNTIIQAGVASASFTLTLPTDDGTANQCLKTNGTGTLTWDDCLGGAGGSGVTSLNGLTGALSIANASGSGSTVTIDNAAADGATKGIAAFNSTNFTASSGVINTIQNIHTGASPSFVAATLTGASSLTLGTGSTNTGSITLKNATNAFNTIIQSAVASASFTLTLPVDDGNSAQCLKTDGNGVLSWGDCIAAAGGVTSLNALTGALSIANASGSGSTITIDNAAADGATKGIAAFNSTNFSASSGLINTIQNINTAATPTFGGLTLSNLTAGSIVFAGTSGLISQDNSNFFWDNSTKRLGIGTNSPNTQIELSSTAPTFRLTDTTASAKSLFVGVDGNKAQIKEIAGADGSLLSLDLTNNRLGIGTNSPSTTLQVNGQITAGSSNIVLTLATGFIDADAITLASSGTAGDDSNSSGLEVFSDGLTLLKGCDDGEILKWNDGIAEWGCSSDVGAVSAVVTIQENDVTVGSNTGTLDFLGSDFNITEAPSGENNIAIDYTNSKITRSDQNETITGAWAFANNLALNPTGVGAGNTGEIRFRELAANGTNYIGFKAPDSISDLVYTLPNHDSSAPAADYVLTWQSGNQLQWKSVSGVGAGGDITDVGDVTTGAAFTAGGSGSLLVFHNGSNSNTLTLQSGASGSNFSLTLPVDDGGSNDCLKTDGSGVLSWAACLGGAGGGVSSLNGLTGALSIANASGSGSTITIDNASTSAKGIAQFNSTNFSASSGNINTIQDIATISTPTFLRETLTGTTSLTLGTASTNTGSIVFKNSTNAFNTTIQSGAAAASYSLTLPVDDGNNTECLKTDGSGVLSWGTCLGGGTGVSSLNSLTGALTIANASGSGSTITIDNASTSAKGIAQFNATNFSASSGNINTIQDIATSSTPTFASMTLSSATGLAVGTASTNTGQIVFRNSTNANTATIRSGTSSGSFTLTLPVDDGNNTECLKTDGSGNLTWAACLGGAGGGVTSLNSLTGALSIANASGSGSTITIDNASTSAKGIAQFNSTNFSASSGNINTIQDIATNSTPTFSSATLTSATALTLGTSSSNSGQIVFRNATNTNTLTVRSGVTTGGSFTLILPVDDGAANDCLKSDGSGTLSWAACLGGAGGGVSSLNGLTGALSIANASGSGSTVTIDNASTSAKGIAQFNATNFSASSGNINTIQDISTSSSPSFASATLTNATSLTLGTLAGNTGSIVFRNSSNSNTTTVRSGAASGSYTLTLPVDDGNNTECLKTDGSGTLSWGACIGAAGGVTSLNGLSGALSIANASGSGSTVTIDNASTSAKGIAQFNATNFSASSGNINTIQDIASTSSPSFVAATLTGGSTLTLGTASTNTGSITLKNATNAFNTIIQSGVASATFTLTLPVDDGNNTECLKTNGSGVLTWAACLGGAGGGVSSLNSLSGDLNIANASGSGSTITIDNAAADGATKGIAAFNSTNFSASSGVINTIQNINTAATPTFASLTLTAASSQIALGTTNVTTISTGSQNASHTVSFPTNLAANDTFCLLTLNNCTGGNVTTSGAATTNRLARFTTGTNIEESLIEDDGANIDITSGNLNMGGTTRISSTGAATFTTVDASGAVTGLTFTASQATNQFIIDPSGANNAATINAAISGGDKTFNLPNLAGTFVIDSGSGGNKVSATSQADGYELQGGTTSRKLTLTGQDITLGNIIQPTTNGNALTIRTTSNNLTLNTVTSGNIQLGSDGTINASTAGGKIEFIAGSDRVTQRNNSSLVFEINGSLASTTTGGNFSATKSGTTITASVGTFSASDVGKFFIWDNGTIDRITAFIGGTQVTVAASGTISPAEGGRVYTSNFYVNASGDIGIGTANQIAGLDVQKGITAASGVAYGTRLQQTLTTAANSDVISSLYINPTFTNTGSFTGVTSNGINIATPTSNGTATTKNALYINSGWDNLIQYSNNSNTGSIQSATLTGTRTYTLPDASGTVCLTSGNCTGVGGAIAGSGTASQIAFFTGIGTQTITSDSNLFWDNASKFLGIGTINPTDNLHIRHNADSGIRLQRNSNSGRSSDITFAAGTAGAGTNYWTVGIDAGNLNSQNFYIYDEVATAHRLFIDGSGDTQLGGGGIGGDVTGRLYVQGRVGVDTLRLENPNATGNNWISFLDGSATELAFWDREQLANIAGTNSKPSYSFFGDTNTGMYRFGADQIGFATGGTQRMVLSTATVADGTCNLTFPDISGCAGTLDLNVSSSVNNNYGLNLDYISTGNGTTQAAARINVQDSTSAATTYGLVINKTDTGGFTTLDALLRLSNSDGCCAGAVVDAILVDSTVNGVDFITDALDASDSDILNAINVGPNNIVGTSAVINFTEFDVASTGHITVGDGFGLDTNAAGDLHLGQTTATNVQLAGGLLATGCTVVNATGALTCSGDISGPSAGNVGYWNRSGTLLQPTTDGDTLRIDGVALSSTAATFTATNSNVNSNSSGNFLDVTLTHGYTYATTQWTDSSTLTNFTWNLTGGGIANGVDLIFGTNNTGQVINARRSFNKTSGSGQFVSTSGSSAFLFEDVATSNASEIQRTANFFTIADCIAACSGGMLNSQVLLNLDQNYANATGTVLRIDNAGTGNSIDLAGTTRTINSTSGNLTLQTTTSGNIILTPAASSATNISAGDLQFGGTQTITSARALNNITGYTQTSGAGSVTVSSGSSFSFSTTNSALGATQNGYVFNYTSSNSTNGNIHNPFTINLSHGSETGGGGDTFNGVRIDNNSNGGGGPITYMLRLDNNDGSAATDGLSFDGNFTDAIDFGAGTITNALSFNGTQVLSGARALNNLTGYTQTSGNFSATGLGTVTFSGTNAISFTSTLNTNVFTLAASGTVSDIGAGTKNDFVITNGALTQQSAANGFGNSINITLPNLSNSLSGGTITARGVLINPGTVAGTFGHGNIIKGFEFAGGSFSTGQIIGAEIGNLTDTGAISTGIKIGTGWDAGLITGSNILSNSATTLSSVTQNISILATGNFNGAGLSIAVGHDSYPIVANWDTSSTAMKIHKCTNVACTSATQFTTAAACVGGCSPAITVGPNGNAYIAHHNDNFSNNDDLGIVVCSNPSCSAHTIVLPDTTGTPGQWASIAIGMDGFPIIAHYRGDTGDLKATKCNNAACSSTTTTSLETTNDIGLYTSIAVPKDGNPVISYFDETNDDLRVYKCTAPNCSTGASVSVDTSNDVGRYNSLTIGVDGLPIIAYYDATNDDLKVVKCKNASCSSIITPVVVDGTVSTSVLFSEIAIGTDGLPVIAYKSSTGRVKVAKCANINCTATSPSPADVAATPTDSNNLALTIGSDGLPIIAYQDATSTRELEVLHCANSSCSSTTGNAVEGIDIGTLSQGFRNFYGLSGAFGGNLYVGTAPGVTNNLMGASTPWGEGNLTVGGNTNIFGKLGIGTSVPTADLHLESSLTSGNLSQIGFSPNTTLTGQTVGLSIDMDTNVTAGSNNRFALSLANVTPSSGAEIGMIIGTGYDLQIWAIGPSLTHGFQVKNISQGFGSVAEAGAMISHNSYYGEEFVEETANDTDYTGDSNAVIGDNRGWSIELTAPGVTSTAQILDDTINGIMQLQAGADNDIIAAFTGVTSSNPHDFIDADNLPVILMKVAVSSADANNRQIYGISDSAVATATEPANGVYFSNINLAGTGTNTLFGRTRSASTNSATNSCGTITPNTYMLLKIVFETDTQVRFYADLDVSNGIAFVDCGTITTNVPQGTYHPYFNAHEDTTSSHILNVDFFRVWQDDAPLEVNASGNVVDPGPAPEVASTSAVITNASMNNTQEQIKALNRLAEDASKNLTATLSADTKFEILDSVGNVVASISDLGEAVFSKVEALIARIQNLFIGNSITINKDAKISGTEKFNAGESEIVIETTKVKEDSLIYLTPKTKTGGLNLYIKEIKPGESFTVSLEKSSDPAEASPSAATAIEFNWLIVGQE